MATRTLASPPRLLPLFARSAASMLPGASLLPFVPGRGGRVPQTELALERVSADPERVAAYARVCGLPLRAHLPMTYPHVLAFPLQMAVMADGAFPFGAVGLVHVENAIVQHERIGVGQPLSIAVSATPPVPHRRGRTFTLLTRVRADGRLVWEGQSTMLHRGGDGTGAAGADASELDLASLPASATWRLPGDLGRRYAAVSGDRNPIHMHPLSARLLGFPGAIVHGMWSKARCVAALESRMPARCEAHVSFRKPIVLPARVQFASTPPADAAPGRDGGGALSERADAAPGRDGGGSPERDGSIRFALRDAEKGTPHLDGAIAPLGEGAVTPLEPRSVKTGDAE
ncbi:MAG: MaoC/PaaZ C-terminal domain-containing protein [Solirubrobacteraceae bacterium]